MRWLEWSCGEFLCLILVKGVIIDMYFVDMVIGSYIRSITSGDLINQQMSFSVKLSSLPHKMQYTIKSDRGFEMDEYANLLLEGLLENRT